ncbi:MAG: epoxyqueuosine reductase QueH [Rickettsiales bacterium]|jgi:predicted adenine nucleotide alpha hydrolase (AANH) superfamily ATPase|nr:epoxyqueuosine reductase QueH [Rickettsiales bacterium]
MCPKKIVLMSCCAPCSAAAIKRLKEKGADFVVIFYNPNIFPRAEHDRRLAEQIKLCEKYGVKYAFSASSHGDHARWLDAVKGFEKGPERGTRCEKCFAMRLKWGAKWAKRNGYDAITSVFGVSPHKDNFQVLRAAKSALPPIGRRGKADFEYIDFNFAYAPEADAYRQKYCGCEFSETYHGK